MALMTVLDAQLAFGDEPLLDGAQFALEERERVGLIGRNGTGKSSLLRVLTGAQALDDGRLQIQQGLRVAWLEQSPAFVAEQTVNDAVSEVLLPLRGLIDDYASGTGDLDALHQQIEALGGWNWTQRVDETLQRLQLDGNRTMGELSGGMQKRVALAQALVLDPEVLLLDEPTNHLDVDAIVWLEGFLRDFTGSVVVISHDRRFLDEVTTRIVELDRGVLRSWPGNFARYQTLKAEQLAQESVTQARADKLLSQEEAWMRQGIEARRTRSQDRIRRLHDLRAERAARRNLPGQVRMEVNADTGRFQGKLIAELQDVDLAWGDKVIARGLNATVMRGDKIGLVGPNGAGKTSLLKLMLGEIKPDHGKVRLSQNIEVAYFDQMRTGLEPDATLEEAINPGSEWIEIGGKRQHVKSYLADFLFSARRAMSPVSSLSGGEWARLLLAHLFARPANVLVLDEPTNDLDIDTLELLEELLQNYDGTVLLVSHDRTFLDHVVTSTLAWDGPGQWREYVGGVDDWLTQSARWQALQQPVSPNEPTTTNAKKPKVEPTSSTQAAPKPIKLSYKEQRELDALPGRIDALEKEQANLREQLADGTLYQTDLQKAIALQARDGEIEEELMLALERWEALASNDA